jgi:uncharacterized protein
MNLNFLELETLEKELSNLPKLHQLAFAASCCERLLPNYNFFCRKHAWGNPIILHAALDQVWLILQGQEVDEATVQQFIENCGKEDTYPNDLDFGGMYCYEAQESLEAICQTLEACLKPDVHLIAKVAKRARNIIEAYVPDADITFNVSWEKAGREKLIEAIASHPFAVRELAKEAEDLQKLKETEELDKNFLESLRTSFDNDGRSLIDLA